MTREELYEFIKDTKDYGWHFSLRNGDSVSVDDVLSAMKKELEQEPCEDTISRAEAIDQMEQSYNILDATDRIKALPSVQAVCGDAVSIKESN